MSSLILPKYYYRRAWLRAFWAVGIGAAAGLAMLSLHWLGATRLLLFSAAGVAFALLVVGWAAPLRLSVPFRAVRKIQVVLGRAARWYVASLAYACVVVPLALFQKERPPTAPHWQERKEPARGANPSQYKGADHPPDPGQPAYIRWMRDSGIPGAYALTPFLLVLAALDEGSEAMEVPTETYTLF